MGVTTNFASEAGPIPLADLDAAFAQTAEQADLTTLQGDVDDLPSSDTPLEPVAGGAAGSSGTLSKSDHRHPPQSWAPNLQTGTTYTIQTSDDSIVVDLSNASAITVTVPATLEEGFSCLIRQSGAGQVTINAGSGATRRQASSYTKTRAQWSEVSLNVRTNVGGSAAEFVLSGDMAA